jgi:hypothetical protein
MSTVWKRISVTLLIFTLICTGGLIYLNRHLESLLTKKIKEAVVTSTDGLYTINLDDISANILTGTVSIKRIVFKPDTLIYKKLASKGLAPKHIYHIQVAYLTLAHIHPLKVYFNKALEIKSILINKPIIRMTYYNVPDFRDTIPKDNRTAYQRLSTYLKSVKIENVIFQDANFKYIDKSLKHNQTTGLKNLTIRINDLLLDSASQFDKSRFYYTKNISVQVNDNQWTTNDGNYIIQLKELTTSTAKGSLRLEGLSLVPRYSEMGFSERIKVRKDRYSIHFKEILLHHINYKCLLTQRRFIASNLSLNNGIIAIFTNKALPDPAIDKGNNYPSIALKRLTLPILIDTVEVNNSSLNYSEYSPESKRKGTVSFDQMNGKIYHVTNDSLALLKNKYSKADFTALLMKRGRINLHLNFKLNSPDGAFTYNGNTGKINARILNPVIRPLALIEIKSGLVNEMKFSGKGNIERSEGTVSMSYTNLKIALLKKDDDNDRLKRKGIISAFVNAFIIIKDNPTENDPLRIANFNYTRQRNASFFNLLWKGILNGIKESIGLGDTVQKEMQNKVQQMDLKKADRAVRREKRKARRAERKRIRAKNS